MRKQTIFLLTLLASLVVSPNLWAQGSKNISISVSRDSHHGTRISHRNGTNSFNINYDGEVKFNNDLTDISFISPGGFVHISKTSFGNKRRVELKGMEGGEIRREYFNGGREKPYEPEGRQFLEEVLPDILRSTRIGAEDRVARIYKENGVNGLLEEFGQIDSDYVLAYYYELAFDLDNLSARDQQKLLRSAGEQLDSDFELARLLTSIGSGMLEDEATEQAFLDAVTNMDSDFEIARVMREMIKEYDLSDKRMVQILDGMDSDFEKSRILMEALGQKNLSEPELITVLELSEHIDSDFEKARIMQIVLGERVLALNGTRLVLNRINEIDSDFEKSRILQQLIGIYELEEEAIELALNALSEIDSDFEKARVLQLLVIEENFSDESFTVMMDRIDEIDSDFEKSNLIQLMLEEEAYNTQTLDRLVASVDAIDSDFETAKVLKMAARVEGLSADDYLDLIKATEDIDSSWERKNVLVEIARNMPKNNQELQNTLRDAARELSDTEYGQLMRELDRN